MRSAAAALGVLALAARALVPQQTPLSLRERRNQVTVAKVAATPQPLKEAAPALAEKLLNEGDEARLRALVEERFEAIDQDVLGALTRSEDAEAAQRAMAAVKAATDERMFVAKQRIEHVLEAGELLEMDKRLAKVFKDGLADAAFLVVLNMNADSTAKEAAQSPDDEAVVQRARVFEHLYTRAQEEWEKRLPDQGKAVLHRLARTTDPAIRRNVLHYYLAPKTHLEVPQGEPIPLDAPQPPLVASADLAKVIANAVASLRQLDLDGDLVRASIEDLRSVAKEARLVLIETAPEADVRQFEHDLSQTWPIHERGGDDIAATTTSGGEVSSPP